MHLHSSGQFGKGGECYGKKVFCKVGDKGGGSLYSFGEGQVSLLLDCLPSNTLAHLWWWRCKRFREKCAKPLTTPLWDIPYTEWKSPWLELTKRPAALQLCNVQKCTFSNVLMSQIVPLPENPLRRRFEKCSCDKSTNLPLATSHLFN